ncbi:MAG: hypothetical protein M3552_15375 [Planctomycetota bacterium]|nr:hypothetical protein [Planctomycetaceae bacterium]MDQ3332011.1 hypothetical protein [Planctomycetota bacterium]
MKRPSRRLRWQLGFAALAFAVAVSPQRLDADLKTWDGRHSIEEIEVTVVYFVPSDRTPLPDWKDRVDYFARRIERFHAREYGGQSVMTANVQPTPFVSKRTTAELREGDANAIFFRTMREADAESEFGRGERKAFPILLVLSDINWKPLEDFYRVHPKDDGYEFEGQLIDGLHFPGAASGGARATYLSDRGVGWGLVSADGWRVPYRGSDCVVYHEGVGHSIGLPHPEPQNGSVMSLAQYRGWIGESWLDDDQKRRLGWTPSERPFDREHDLFSTFTALPEPRIPKPDEPVSLKLTWPKDANPKSCRVRIQTALFGPWLDVPQADSNHFESMSLGGFDRPTPVSYRIDAETQDGAQVELWGYFQVRAEPNQIPLPPEPESAATSNMAVAGKAPDHASATGSVAAEIDLLSKIAVDRDAVSGQWTLSDGRLDSPKAFGARIDLREDVPAEYVLTVIAEPLDEPNGLILGQRLDGNRFLVLLNYGDPTSPASAIENVDGLNVGRNETSSTGPLFQKGRPSQILCTVRKESVRVLVDGQQVIDWKGKPSRLSLGEYWETPNGGLFLGAYDCRYRFHRVGLTPLAESKDEPAKLP